MSIKEYKAIRAKGLEIEWLNNEFDSIYEKFINSKDIDSEAVDLLTMWCLRSYKLAKKVTSQPPPLEKLDFAVFKIIEDWGKGDQVYCNSLRLCLKETLNYRSSIYGKTEIKQVIQRASQLSDPKSCYTVLEIILKTCSIKSVLDYVSADFIERSFSKLAYQDDRSGIVGRFLAAGLINSTPDEWFAYLTPFLHSSVARNNVLTYFLEPILKQHRSEDTKFSEFFEICQQQNNNGLEISALKAARNANLDVKDLTLKSKAIITSLESIDLRERFDALGLLCTSTRKLTTPVSPLVYDLITNSCDSILAQGEPKARSDVFGSFRHLITRAQCLRDEQCESKMRYREFIKFLHEWCGLNLRAGMPYRCMAMAVKLLELLALTNELQLTELIVRGLVGCIACNFEDIRMASAALLSTPNCGAERFEIDSEKLMERGFEMVLRTRTSDSGAVLLRYVSTLRSSDASDAKNSASNSNSCTTDSNTNIGSTAGDVLHSIMSTLDTLLTTIKVDLIDLAKHTCLHGLLTALKLFVNDPDFDINRSLDISKSVWELCAPFTSKKLPNEVSDFCWKAIKEACSLVETIALKLPKKLKETNQVPILITTMATLLTETQHWGVLSYIPLAYTAVGKQDPKLAVSAAFQHISALQNGKISRSVVRRSAGLPLLVTAALAVDFNIEFVEAIFDLASKPTIAIADSQNLTLPQVHGLNCLRSIYMDAALTKQSIKFVERGLSLSLMYFSHPEWSLRNCAAMLFSTLNKRIFGPQTAPMPANVFFQRFKSAHKILCDCLESANRESSLDNVYPALALLTRLKPSNNDENRVLMPFWEPVIDLLGSKNWQVRATAGKALANMVKSSEKLDAGIEFLGAMTLSDQNEVHGLSIAAKLLFQECDQTALREHAMDVCVLLKPLILKNKCMEVNVELYQIYQLFSTERLIEFSEFSNYKHFNPSVGVFEALQVRDSPNNITVYVNKPGMLPVYKVLDNSCFTKDACLTILNAKNELPEIQAICLQKSPFHPEILDLAMEIALSGDRPLSVRQQALLYTCRAQQNTSTKFSEAKLNNQLIDLLLLFASDDAPRESRMCTIECITALFDLNPPPTLLYALYKLLSDDEEEIRIFSAQKTSQLLKVGELSPPACERLIMSEIPPQVIASKLCESLIEDTKKAVKSFTNPMDELFVVERESQYRDEVRAVEFQQQFCQPTKEHYEIASAANDLINKLNWEDMFQANEDAELVLIKARINAILMTFFKSSN